MSDLTLSVFIMTYGNKARLRRFCHFSHNWQNT